MVAVCVSSFAACGHRPRVIQSFCNSSGNLATLAAMRRASSLLSSFAAERRPGMPTNAPFVELVRLSRTSIADELREEHRRMVLGE
jgi:hypothetical protein